MHKSRVKGEEESAEGKEKKSKEEKVKNPSSDRFSVFGPEESDEAFQRFFFLHSVFVSFSRVSRRSLWPKKETPTQSASLTSRRLCLCVNVRACIQVVSFECVRACVCVFACTSLRCHIVVEVVVVVVVARW